MRRNYKNNKFRNNTDNGTMTSRSPMGPVNQYVSEPTAKGVSEWTVRQYGNKLNLAPVSLHLDPMTEAKTIPQPYPIINANNASLEKSYQGTPNTNGIILNDLAVNPHSNLINEFDSGKLNLRVAYQYLNMGKQKAESVQPYEATNSQYQKAFDEGRSRVAAELWMSSTFNSSTFKSNMPYMKDSMTSALVYYQTVLMNYATVMAKFNQLTLLNQDLINMGYEREASILVELFTRMEKKVFHNKFFILAKNLKDEYFDKKWFAYVNSILNVPSRKTNSTRDPLLTVVGVHELPEIEISLPDTATPYFTSKLLQGRTYYYDKPSGQAGTLPMLMSKEVQLEELFKNTLEMLDQNNILNWARKLYLKDKTELYTYAANPDQYMNMLSLQLDSLESVFRDFKRAFQDMKVFLHIAKRAGLINWEQGTEFVLYKSKQATSAVNNINIRDIILATCASPSRMVFNQNTQKWGFYSLWDEYDGIPIFDRNNGGMDIVFSVKRDLAGIELFGEDALELCLPYLFKHDSDLSVIKMINRNASIIHIKRSNLTGEQVQTNAVLSRLVPKKGLIPYNKIGLLTVPQVKVPSQAEDDASTISAIIRLMTHLFKMGNVEFKTNDVTTYANPSLICLVDGEMESAALETKIHIQRNTPMSGLK